MKYLNASINSVSNKLGNTWDDSKEMLKRHKPEMISFARHERKCLIFKQRKIM